jgi:hypothetical protein
MGNHTLMALLHWKIFDGILTGNPFLLKSLLVGNSHSINWKIFETVIFELKQGEISSYPGFTFGA